MRVHDQGLSPRCTAAMSAGHSSRASRYCTPSAWALKTPSVVDLAPDADPDIPWTWRPHAFVPDSWSGQILAPSDLLDNPLYFAGGDKYAFTGLKDTTRHLRRVVGKTVGKSCADPLADRSPAFRSPPVPSVSIPRALRKTMRVLLRVRESMHTSALRQEGYLPHLARGRVTPHRWRAVWPHHATSARHPT